MRHHHRRVAARAPAAGPAFSEAKALTWLVTYGPARFSDGRIAGIVTVTRLRQIVGREALRAQPAQ
jgi:hypothetical protein